MCEMRTMIYTAHRNRAQYLYFFCFQSNIRTHSRRKLPPLDLFCTQNKKDETGNVLNRVKSIEKWHKRKSINQTNRNRNSNSNSVVDRKKITCIILHHFHDWTKSIGYTILRLYVECCKICGGDDVAHRKICGKERKNANCCHLMLDCKDTMGLI